MTRSSIRTAAAAALALAAATSVSVAAAAESVKATVNGMVCSFCAQGIEKRLSKLPATQAVYVDLKRKVVAVQAKEGQKLDNKVITTEITEAGYDVTKLETVAKTVDQIRAEAQGAK